MVGACVGGLPADAGDQRMACADDTAASAVSHGAVQTGDGTAPGGEGQAPALVTASVSEAPIRVEEHGDSAARADAARPTGCCIEALDVHVAQSFFESDYLAGSIIEVTIDLNALEADCRDCVLEWNEWTTYVPEAMSGLGVQPRTWQNHRVINPVAAGMWSDWDRAVVQTVRGRRTVRIFDCPALARRKWVNGEWIPFDRDRLLLIEIRVRNAERADVLDCPCAFQELSYSFVQRLRIRNGRLEGGLVASGPGPHNWRVWMD